METGNGQYIFHYIIEQQSCFLTLTERQFSKKTAFDFLDDLAQEFHDQYGHKINTAVRPYSFIEFDIYIQKAKKAYSDSRGRRKLNNLNTELQDVHRIMVKNIEAVLERGGQLSVLETQSQNLTEQSRKYRKDAESLNATSLAVIAGDPDLGSKRSVPPPA
jgi:vesicle transport protein SEC22